MTNEFTRAKIIWIKEGDYSMNYMNKLERKFGKYAISNLSLWLIVGYAIGYICVYIPGLNRLLSLLMLDPALVMKGQVWRLVTWIVMPPSYSNIFFYMIMMLFYYQLGNQLERTWGTFRFNFYIFGGIIFTAVGVMVLYLILSLLGADTSMMGYYVSTNYINMSIFLAFAVCYPDMQIMLYFIIPLKMKWLAYFYVVLTAISFFQSSWTGRIVIFMSLLNFLIFFLSTRNYKRVSPSEIHRKRAFRAQVAEPRRYKNQLYKHKCAVCGRTDLDDPTLEFRFCSKCEGNYEYCQEHLFTHEHIHRH